MQVWKLAYKKIPEDPNMYLFHTGFCFNIGTSCFWIKSSYTAWYIPGLIMTHVTCQKYVRHFKPHLLSIVHLQFLLFPFLHSVVVIMHILWWWLDLFLYHSWQKGSFWDKFQKEVWNWIIIIILSRFGPGGPLWSQTSVLTVLPMISSLVEQNYINGKQ
jgi:hypothetical protein